MNLKFSVLIGIALQLGATVICAEQPTNAWGLPSCGTQLSLRCDVSAITNRALQPVNAQIELWNRSSNVIKADLTTVIYDVGLKAKGPDGKEIKSKLPDLKTLELVRVSSQKLNPNEKMLVTVNLSEAFDMKDGVVYEITATRTVHVINGEKRVQSCRVVSNELKLIFPEAKSK